MPIALLPAAIFFANAVLYVTFFSRLPETSDALNIPPSALGVALLLQSVGALCGFPIAAGLLRRIGARRTAGICLIGAACVLPLAASGNLFASTYGFAGMLMVYGFLMAILEVAKNLLAGRIEQRSKRKVMSFSHGCWSLGMFCGALAGGQAAVAGASVVQTLVAAACLILPLAVLLIAYPGPPEPEEPPATQPKWARPDAFIIVLLVLVAGFAISEGAFYDWSMFYLKDDLQLDAHIAAQVYGAFTLGMFGMRMLGDALRSRLTTGRLVRCMAASVITGFAIIAWAPNATLLTLGFALSGGGVALAAPLAATIAMSHPTRSPATTMAAYSATSLFALFTVPAILGSVVDAAGAIYALAAPLPVLIFVLCFTPALIARLR